MVAFWVEMGVAYLEINKLPSLHEIDIPMCVKFKKSTVEFHTSKNILKMIKQRNQSCQVLFYISNTHLYTLVCRFHVGSLLISK
jgi:hypothetical protein